MSGKGGVPGFPDTFFGDLTYDEIFDSKKLRKIRGAYLFLEKCIDEAKDEICSREQESRKLGGGI